jgi:MFS family permease
MTETRPFYYDPRVIITAGCLIAIVTFGARSSFGLFTHPISDFHGWDREVYGLAMAIQNLAWGVVQPIAGAYADRYGTARVLAIGAVMYAAGMFLTAFSHTPLLITMTGGILTGAGIATASFTLVMGAFGRLMPPEKRSWSFGVATAAGSLGQFIFAPLGQAFIAAYGWNTAIMLIAALVLLIIPMSFPLSAPAPPRPANEGPQPRLADTLRSAFGHSSYLLLAAGFFVCGFHLAFVTIHTPAYLVENGISAWLAAWFIGIVGVFNVVGAYSSGIIGGKYRRVLPLSAIYFLRAVLMALFLILPVTPLTTVVFAAALGLLWLSTVPLTMGLIAAMFGTRYIGTLYGFVFFSHQVGAFFGVWLGGKFHDIYGSYDAVWWIGVALGVFAGLVHLPIREARAPNFAT